MQQVQYPQQPMNMQQQAYQAAYTQPGAQVVVVSNASTMLSVQDIFINCMPP